MDLALVISLFVGVPCWCWVFFGAQRVGRG
jgi:hypothetical protein